MIINPVIGSWFSDGFIESFEAIYAWVVSVVGSIFNRDLSDWDIVQVLTFANDSIRFLDSIFPMVTAFEILLVGFSAKLVVILAKYLIGFLPGVNG